mgnify:CR=1 FL=1
MDKREFFKSLLISGTSVAGGMATYHYFFKKDLVPSGEEWKNAKQRNQADLKNLPTEETVLSDAKKRIEKHRKGNFSIKLIRPDNSPLAKQEISLTLKKHTVDWGCSAAGSAQLLAKDETHRKRSKYFAALFDCTTAKCYWDERWHQPIERHRGRRIYNLFLDEVKWAESLGLKVKGHPLIWTVPKAIPKWLHNYDLERQKEFLKNHVQSLIEAAGPAVQLWDLCNEMLWEPAFKNIDQRKWPHLDPTEDIADYIAEGLTWAREANPNAIYALNDYGLIYTYREEISAKEQRDRYLQIVEALRQRNQVPNAIGCQSHVGGKFHLGAFEKSLQHLAQAELPLQVTEFWAQDKDFSKELSKDELEEERAKYICDMYTVGFSVPQLNHFTYWGSKVFFNDKNEPTYTYKKLHQLIKEEWATEIKSTTDKAGKIAFKGFKGIYAVKISNQQESLTEFELNDESEQTITVY